MTLSWAAGRLDAGACHGPARVCTGMAMYVRSAAGGLAALSGMVLLAPDALAFRVARVLLEMTGIGFGLYCLAALAMVMWGFWLRFQEHR